MRSKASHAFLQRARGPPAKVARCSLRSRNGHVIKVRVQECGLRTDGWFMALGLAELSASPVPAKRGRQWGNRHKMTRAATRAKTRSRTGQRDRHACTQVVHTATRMSSLSELPDDLLRELIS